MHEYPVQRPRGEHDEFESSRDLPKKNRKAFNKSAQDTDQESVQVETKPGLAWTEPEQKVRERRARRTAPAIVDTEPAVQVETNFKPEEFEIPQHEPVSRTEKTPEQVAAENRREATTIPPEFEGKEFDEIKLSHDPINKLLQKMSEDPEVKFNVKDAGFHYRVVIPTRDEGDAIMGQWEAVNTYHDMLKLRASIPDEIREAGDIYTFDFKNGGTWGKVGTFANVEAFWNRLKDINDKLSKYHSEVHALLNDIYKEQLPDEYAMAVKHGGIQHEALEKQQELFARMQTADAAWNALYDKTRGRDRTPEEEEESHRLSMEKQEAENKLKSLMEITDKYEADPLETEPLTDPDKVRTRKNELWNDYHSMDVKRMESLENFKRATILNRQWSGLQSKLEEAGELDKSTASGEVTAKSAHADEKTDADKDAQADKGDTRAEWKKTLGNLIAGVEKKLGEAKEFASERFNALRQNLATRDWNLANHLNQLGHDVVADVKAGGRKVKSVAMNPREALRSARTSAERAKAYGAYFAQRGDTLDKKANKLKIDIASRIEAYNKLPFRQKAYITGALIGGSALTAAFALPTIPSILAGLMFGQRAVAGAGLYLNKRKKIEEKIKVKGNEYWLTNKSESAKRAYAAVLGTAYMSITAFAGHTATEKLIDWLGNALGHPVAKPDIAAPKAAVEAGSLPHASVAPRVEPPPAAPAAEPALAPEAARSASALEKPVPDAPPAPAKAPVVVQEATQQSQARPETAQAKPESAAADGAKAAGEGVGEEAEAEMKFEMPKHADFSIHEDDTTISPYDVTPVDNAQTDDVLSVEEAETEAGTAGEQSAPAKHDLQKGTVPETTEYKKVDITQPQATAEAPATAPAEIPTTAPGIVTNSSGLEIHTAEPHLYNGAEAGNKYVFGGSHVERIAAITKYLEKDPFAVIYGPDRTGTYRVPWFLSEGKFVVSGPPMKTGWGIFSSFMKPPGPEDLKSFIK
jgi:hypothetical protein